MEIEYNFFRLIEAWCRLRENGIALGKMPRRMKKVENSHWSRRDTRAKRRLYSYMRHKLIKLNTTNNGRSNQE